MVECGLLLRISLSPLQFHNSPRRNPRLPSRRPNILGSVRICKQFLDFLECFPSCLWEHEEHVDKHGQAKHAKDEVSLPLDIYECRRDKVTEGEVESPVGGGCESDGFAANSEWVEFWGVNPRNGAPGRSEGRDKEVRTGDYSF